VIITHAHHDHIEAVHHFDKEWLTLGQLIKNEDESPFPALTQIEVYGKDEKLS